MFMANCIKNEYEDWDSNDLPWAKMCELAIYCPESNIAQAISSWVHLKSEKPLHDFLGMTKEEFDSWCLSNKFPDRIRGKKCKH